MLAEACSCKDLCNINVLQFIDGRRTLVLTIEFSKVLFTQASPWKKYKKKKKKESSNYY